jgi:hypothetical protein
MQENTEIFIQKARKTHGDVYDYSHVEYVKSASPVKIICKIHGVFNQRPNDHIQGQGCRACGIMNFNKKRTYSPGQFIQKARETHGGRYDYSESNYVNSRTKIKIICKVHGSFKQFPPKHLSGQGCPGCGGSERISFEKFLELASVHHKNKNYSYAPSEYETASSMLTINCPTHGPFRQLACNHIRGQGCRKCGRKNFGLQCRKTHADFLIEVQKVHKDRYNYSKVNYKMAHEKICIICPKHGEFWQTPRHHLNGNGCNKCTTAISKMETAFLNHLNIKDRQVVIGPARVDGCDPATKTIYEFLGDFWHGNPNKFNPIEMNDVRKRTYGDLHEETLRRFNQLKQLGYVVKYIWESDWMKWLKDQTQTLNLKVYPD